MTNKETKSFIDHLNLPAGNVWRGDCPSCGGKNTFSIRNELGRVYFICFRASCKNVGSTKGEVDVVALVEDFFKQSETHLGKFSVPDHWILAHQNERAFNFLVEHWCDEAYISGQVDIRYDPKQDRVVFLIGKTGEPSGAVGRALNRSVLPKWYNYHKVHQEPLIVRKITPQVLHRGESPKVGVIVEDAVSATRASCIMDGIALLGTELLDTYISHLLPYSSLIVALDKDASGKAIDISRHLQWHVPNVDIRLLERDLKYEKEERIREILCF